MSAFERYLSVWIFVCIVVGIGLGHLMTSVFYPIGSTEVAEATNPVAILIWLMVLPMLVKINFRSLPKVGSKGRGIGVTLCCRLSGS